MTRKPSTLAGRLRAFTLVAVAMGLVLSAPTPATAADNGLNWDDRHSQELTQALHQMHHVWNSGDIARLKDLVLGDEHLVTFELDPETHQPIRLSSKADLDKFIDAVVSAEEKGETSLDEPVVRCRANGTFGICTEECSVHVKFKDGAQVHHKIWSTAFAVKQDNQWKWIQWHMSVASPPVIEKPASPAGVR